MSYELICSHCNKVFEASSQKQFSDQKWRAKNGLKIFCSRECRLLSKGHNPTPTIFQCAFCGKEIVRDSHHIDKRSKSTRRFCNASCAASYNNTHKTTGTRRSKLEKWLENKLTTLYPTLEIKYCDKSAINSELDIYIPSLRLAFELNGIYHYEPIHGLDKLNQVQRNDANKFQLCHENNISLCIIDTSKQVYVTEKSSQPYLKIITNIINEALPH